MKRILFFDGVCVLCDGLVTWAINRAIANFKPGQMYFSTLQGKTAPTLLKTTDLNLDSVVYYRDENTYKKSKAILWLLYDMNGFYKSLSIMLRLFPTNFADFIYDLVAKSRYKIFGKSEICRLPSPQEKLFMLD